MKVRNRRSENERGKSYVLKSVFIQVFFKNFKFEMEFNVERKQKRERESERERKEPQTFKKSAHSSDEILI